MATIPMSPDVPGQPCDPVHLEEWRARADRVWRQTEPEHLRAEDALVLGTVAVPRLLADRAELLADNPIAWPEDCGAAEEIRVARAQYQAGNLEAAEDAVIMAQISVQRGGECQVEE